MNPIEKRSIIAGLYGNALEWYDFLLYASFAPLFAALFFPSSIPFLSILATFGVFSIGFFMRPLGGMLLGHYADQYGRRKALIISVTIMTLSTAFIAFVPSYKQAGIIAPFLFVFLRLIQGLAVGGELPGATTFLVEHMSANKRGFAGSLVLSTAFLGIFVGSFVASWLSTTLTETALLEWGWRMAYLIGAGLGIIGIYLRFTSTEPLSFENATKTTEIPAKIIWMQHRSKLFLAVLFTSIMAIGNYILIAYATTFLIRTSGFFLKDALTINFIALLFLTVLIPILGLLSDYIGRKPVFLFGAISLFVLIVPVFHLLLSNNWWYALSGELLLSLALAPLNASVPTIITEFFPTAIRASGTSIGYNIGQAVFGGTVPLIALSLVEYTGNKYAPSFYILFWSAMALIGAKYLKESFHIKLN